MRIIKSEEDLAVGVAWLAQNIPEFARVLPQLTPLPLRLKPDGFAPLLSAIMSQQVSLASAAAITRRMEEAGLVCEAAILLASEDDLRNCGLSRQKIRYAKALAEAAIDFKALRTASSDEVIETLVQVPGIGPWTAEIYTMFSLGHADIFAPGDLALQIAAQDLFQLPERPSERKLRQMALAWSPWRSVAARALFAYYRVIKGREGI